jgi:hypothetical protein
VNVRVRENWTNPDGTVTAWPEGTTVRVQLYANNQEVSGRVLSLNAQNPSGAFENLPKNDTSGRAITYTAKAVSVTGYTGEGEMPQGTLQAAGSGAEARPPVGAFPQPAAKAAGCLPEGSAAEAEKHIFSPCTLTFLKSFKFCPAGAKGGCNPPSVLIR